MKKRKLLKSILALCLVVACAMIPAAAAYENVDFVENAGQGEIQPRLVERINFDIPGDFEMYTLKSGCYLYKGDKVTVSGSWYEPRNLQVRLREAEGRAVTVNLGIDDTYTFTVPVTGSYSLEVACSYDVSGELIVDW